MTLLQSSPRRAPVSRSSPVTYRRRSVWSLAPNVALAFVLPFAVPPVFGQCELQELTASDGVPGDYFGWSVAIDGDIAVIGSVRADTMALDAGAAYVFRLVGADWLEDQKLTPSDIAFSDEFGLSVAVDGDVVAIGAHREDEACGGGIDCNAGAVYVFRFDGFSWVEEQKIVASDAEDGDDFGEAVGLSGDVLVVGARRDDDIADSGGSAYVFRFDGTSWIEEANLVAAGTTEFESFGDTVAVQGDLVAVGRTEAGVGTIFPGDSGSVFLYRYDGTQWNEEAQLIPFGRRRSGPLRHSDLHR